MKVMKTSQRLNFSSRSISENGILENPKGSMKARGWKVLVVWECETKNIEDLSNRIRSFLEGKPDNE